MSENESLTPPPAFRMEQEPGPPGVVLLALAGEIDLATSGQFRGAIDRALSTPGSSVVIDMTDVTFMDSTMLRELLRAHKDVDAGGGRLVIAGVQAAVRRLFELTGTSGLFVLADDREAALGAVQG
jgi:anti-sigma B factor antagonist